MRSPAAQTRLATLAVLAAGLFLAACLSALAMPSGPERAHAPVAVSAKRTTPAPSAVQLLPLALPGPQSQIAPPAGSTSRHVASASQPLTVAEWAPDRARAPPSL